MHGLQIWIADFGSQHKFWLGPTLKITLALAAAWMSHAALSRANPRWRRLVWRATAIGCVLITLSAVFPPPLALHVLPAPSDEEDAAAAEQPAPGEIAADAAPMAPIVVVAAAPVEPATPESFCPRYNPAEYYPVARVEVSGGAGPATEASVETASAERAAEPITVATAEPAEPANPVDAVASVDEAPAAAATSPLFNWRMWLAIWSVGAAWKLIDTLLGMQKLHGIRRRATAVPPGLPIRLGRWPASWVAPARRGAGHRRDWQPLHHGGLAASDSDPQRAVSEKARARAAGDPVP